MQFKRQFGNTAVEKVSTRSLASKVIPNQTKSLAEQVQRMVSGNMFGVQQLPVEFQEDTEDDHTPLMEIDQSDPLTSRSERVETFKQLHKGLIDLGKQPDPVQKPADQ